MVLSDVVYLLLACFGLAAIAENWATLFVVIRYIGAAYLIYLGYKLITALPKAQETMGPKQNSEALGGFRGAGNRMTYMAMNRRRFLVKQCHETL